MDPDKIRIYDRRNPGNVTIRSSLLRSRLVNRLRLAAGAPVESTELVEALYYDDADGGPLTATACIATLARRLGRCGFPIKHCGYRKYAWIATPYLAE